MSKLSFVFSSMNSGKSLNLLTKNFMLKQKGFSTILMKPSIDDRTETISSRLGIEEDCILIPEKTYIIDLIYNGKKHIPKQFVDYILVDEAQFLTKDHVWQLSDLVDNYDVNVICYGLKLNWQGEFFEGSHELMKISDELIQTETYCKENQGSPALFHVKLEESDSPIETGYEDMYDTVSRKIWKKWWDIRNES